MDMKTYPVIDPVATGNNIRRLRMERGLTVRELQSYFGFEEPRAIYKWQKGESLPTVDNLYALGVLFEVPIDQILVPVIKLHIVSEQQAESCCSHHFSPAILDTASVRCSFHHCSVCIACCVTGHTFSCAHGKDQHLIVIDFVISESGLYALHMEMSVWMQENV